MSAPRIRHLVLPLSKLHALRRNPQYLSERQTEALKASIDRDGFIAPIVVRKRADKYEILSGNHRVLACRELGHNSIACVLIDPCDNARAARIAVNMNTVHGDPNAELIAPFLAEAPDAALRDIYLGDDLLADVRRFDLILSERLSSLQIPDALNSESIGANNIPECTCPKCGRLHVADARKTSKSGKSSRQTIGK